MEKISIIIPCRNEEKYIKGCLESILNSDYPKDLIEVFVVDGNSTDLTRKIVKNYSEKFNFIKLLINNQEKVSYAMNMGINHSSGNYIIRLDAHSEFPPNYFSKLIEWSKKINADNIGTCCITDVKNKTLKTNSIKLVLSNKFGVGNSIFRIGINEVKEVDTVPFGCYRKDVFDKFGLFDIRLDRDQDIELNKRIKRKGGKIYIIPDISSTYFSRETFYELAKNNFHTGFWNILTVYLTKRIDALSMRHFVPLIFLLSLIVPFFLSLWIPQLAILTLISLVFYISSLLIISHKINYNSTSLFYLIWTFVVIHFSYGSGSLFGLFRIDKFIRGT